MQDIKRLAYPLLIIVLAAFLTKLTAATIQSEYLSTLLILLGVTALCLFGASLNKSRKKRSNAVVVKVIAIVVVVLLLVMQLGYFDIPYIRDVFAYLGIDTFYINMLYIFCGYLFVD